MMKIIKHLLFIIPFWVPAVMAEEKPQLMFDGTAEACEEAVAACHGKKECIEELAKQGCEVDRLNQQPKDSEILEQFRQFQLPKN